MLHVPVLQVDEVLQVEISGVLGQIDGVHILEEKTTGNRFNDGVFRYNTKLNSTGAEKQRQRQCKHKRGKKLEKKMRYNLAVTKSDTEEEEKMKKEKKSKMW